MTDLATFLIGASLIILIVVFLSITVPYSLAFHYCARMLKIENRSFGKSYIITLWVLFFPYILISMYDKIGGGWEIVGLVGAVVTSLLFIKGTYKTTYLKSIACFFLSDIVFVIFMILVILGIILAVKIA